jgi:hypothetical protein
MRPAATTVVKAACLRGQVWSRWSCMQRWASGMVRGCLGVVQVPLEVMSHGVMGCTARRRARAGPG